MGGMIESVQDPMLKQLVQQTEAKITPDLKRNYDAIVVSGMKLMFSEGTHQEMVSYLENIKNPEDVPKLVAHGIVKVLSIIQNQSQQAEPFPAAGPACLTLMAQALEYVENTTPIEVSKEMIDETVTMIKEGIFSLYKITPEVLTALQNRKKDAQPGAPPTAPAQPPQPAPQTEAPEEEE